MIQLEFIHNHHRVSFLVNRVKYIFYENMNEYWTLYRSICTAIEKTSVSEYSDENHCISKITIDGEVISKSDEFIHVNHFYSIEEDCKLGTKSLLYRYCIKEIQDNSMQDEFLQLSSMLQLLSTILSNDEIVYETNELTAKTLIKLFNISFLKEELTINSRDLSYEEIILIQLKLISKIVSLEKRFIIVVDIPLLTNRIKNYIDSMSNCLILVICFKSEKLNYTDNLYIRHNDFENDEDLYERMIEMSNCYTYKDYKESLKTECLKAVCK